jgi:hypothetical protein
MKRANPTNKNMEDRKYFYFLTTISGPFDTVEEAAKFYKTTTYKETERYRLVPINLSTGNFIW